VPYPNDRRKHRPEGEEVLSTDYVAMLIAAGGEVRSSDLDASRERLQTRQYGRRKDDLPLPPQNTRRRAED